MIVTPYSFSILVTFCNIGPFKIPKNYFGKKFSPLPSHVIPNSTELYENYEISASQQYRRTPFTNSTAKSGVRTTRNQGNDLFRHSDGLIHTTRATPRPLPSDTRKRWIVVHVRKKYACIIALRNDFGTDRVSFHHVPTFPKQREATITSKLLELYNFPFLFKGGKKYFFFPFFLSFFFFPWIHSNEPRAQLKRYTWTVGKIF